MNLIISCKALARITTHQTLKIEGHIKKKKVQAVKDHIEHQQQVLQHLKDNTTLVQNRRKQQVAQHRSEKCFDVGDWVFLRLHLKQAIYEKEMLAILHALKKWRPYRMGRLFKDEDLEAFFCAIYIIQTDWINEARDEWKKGKEVWPLIQKFLKVSVQNNIVRT